MYLFGNHNIRFFLHSSSPSEIGRMSQEVDTTIEALEAKASALRSGDRDRDEAWDIWYDLVANPKKYDASQSKSILRRLLAVTHIGCDYGPSERSLMMESLVFPDVRHQRYPDMLLDLHQENPFEYPLDMELPEAVRVPQPNGSYARYYSAFGFAVREAPRFALRLIEYVSDVTLCQRPLYAWPLLACIIDDIFRGPMEFTDDYIRLGCYLLQPCFDFRFPIVGGAARDDVFELEPQALLTRVRVHRTVPLAPLAKFERDLDAAIQRVTTYRKHFEDCVLDALCSQQVVPRDLLPLILQYAALPTFS